MFGLKLNKRVMRLERDNDTLPRHIVQLQKDVKQLKCSHPEDQREYNLTGSKWLFLLSEYPMIESCKLCYKEMDELTEKQWKKRELKIAEDRVKELKKK